MQQPVPPPVFENIGGSFQYRIQSPQDLKRILDMDPALWAALCVPVAALNGDPAFFRALDSDGNGIIRVDEVRRAVEWQLGMLRDPEILSAPAPECAPEDLNENFPDAAALKQFIACHDAELLDAGKLSLPKIRAVLGERLSGPLAGDGVLKAAALAGSGGEALFADITGLTGGTPASDGSAGVNAALLEKFLNDARSFLDWAATAEQPLFRGQDPMPYYGAFQALNGKIDEYFRFCELIKLDPANAGRFKLDPAALPALDIHDSAAVDAVLGKAPLAMPNAECRLVLDENVNPAYRKAAQNFASVFGAAELSPESWEAVKNDLQPYMDYLCKAEGDLAGRLGKERLEAILNGEEADILRRKFAEDSALGGVLNSLRQLERVLLYKQYLMEFVNNFVSFAALFDPARNSMLQAGRLVMDGRSYHLAVWINSVAEHRKIAVSSHLCMIYLEVISSLPGAKPRYLAVAVTGGALTRIYVGKPAFFIDNDQVTYHGRIIDLVEGPISFGQTVLAPFRRISSALGDKLQKMTDFSSTEKQLTDAVNTGKAPTPPPSSGNSKGFLGNGSMLLLAGGLSVAALGAAASFILKSISGAIATLSEMPGWKLLLWLLIIIAIFLVPAAIFAFLKMRKRSLTVFLEAGGWAVNLPMRLNVQVSGIFTRSGIYPRGSRFIFVRTIRRWVWRLMLFLLLAGALVSWGLYKGWFDCMVRSKSCPAPAAQCERPAPAAPAPAAAQTAPAEQGTAPEGK